MSINKSENSSANAATKPTAADAKNTAAESAGKGASQSKATAKEATTVRFISRRVWPD